MLYYLATPYSKWPKGLEDAFEEASKLAARLVQQRFRVYSPIAHTHPIAKYGKLDPLDHDLWLPFDEEMMEKCDILLVANMPGWQESKGVAHEIQYFIKHSKPVHYLDVSTLKCIMKEFAG